MGGACGTRGSNEICLKILVGNLNGRDHSKDLVVDGGWECGNLNHLAQNRDQ
jgi:hypothetical protein